MQTLDGMTYAVCAYLDKIMTSKPTTTFILSSKLLRNFNHEPKHLKMQGSEETSDICISSSCKEAKLKLGIDRRREKV